MENEEVSRLRIAWANGSFKQLQVRGLGMWKLAC